MSEKPGKKTGEGQLMEIPVDQIKIPDERARSRWTEEQIEYLKASLSKFGMIQFPIVRRLENGTYELIDGENRIRTARELGQERIKCYVVDMSDYDAALANLMMNVARGTQDPIGMAIALKNAIEAGMTVEEVAKAVNRSEQWVKFMLHLLELPEMYQEALKEGKLNVTHIREALRLPDLYEIDAALQTAMRLNWPASTLRNYVNNRLEQLKKHQRMVEETGIEAPPPPPQPEELVKYGQCLVCGRMVPRDQIYLPATCADCYQLAQYVVQNVGTGKDAMNLIYTALTHYQAFLRYQQQFMIQKQMEQSGYPPQMPQQMNPSVMSPTQPSQQEKREE